MDILSDYTDEQVRKPADEPTPPVGHGRYDAVHEIQSGGACQCWRADAAEAFEALE